MTNKKWTTLLTSPTPGDEVGPEGNIVLRERKDNAFNYATHWRKGGTDSDAGQHYSGEYFDNIDDAKQSFARRSGHRTFADYVKSQEVRGEV